ncbi:unnamed protein product [Fusarium venenatum]|uniref:Helicase C-terminal domain-containing protein n=1 Tax=Fusarium venenatum TaxID=56646 RepID=A0A2L2T5N0_9HYPO|nr:uncharacterized protein FVRRES_04777 [Fusarium venenatum]CEI60341.1 unnamed protein product [Fusarium venenatum]
MKAHHIRNSSTKIHKAVVSLQSETRWCLTGTPIQNSLDDLRSLLQFLHFEPLCQSKTFEEYVVAPLRNEANEDHNLDPSRNLRLLLKACCLRRTQEKLNLPTTTMYKVPVTPTEVEKAMFQRILYDCRQEFDIMAGKGKGVKKFNILFSAIMKFRRVCNHGDTKLHITTPKQSNFLTVPTMKQITSRTPNVELDCNFVAMLLWSTTCFVGWTAVSSAIGFFPNKNVNIVSRTTSPQSMHTPEPPSTNSYSIPSVDPLRGQSSKMSTVINNIKESCLDNNLKSVLFSSWRDTLDILATMLIAEGIAFVQVDGRNPLAGRTELLSSFRQDRAIKVLLISINTGAVGLTPTEANMVHIVEPQWNPTIKNQAIARVVRMGQTRPVTIFKYIMKDSIPANFEQSVLKLQERKTQIIKLSMQDKNNDEFEGNIDRFKFAIDPQEWESSC